MQVYTSQLSRIVYNLLAHIRVIITYFEVSIDLMKISYEMKNKMKLHVHYRVTGPVEGNRDCFKGAVSRHLKSFLQCIYIYLKWTETYYIFRSPLKSKR